jgi:hypothetical protein
VGSRTTTSALWRPAARQDSRGSAATDAPIWAARGKQFDWVAEDPCGNPVELFQPILPEARLTEPRA